MFSQHPTDSTLTDKFKVSIIGCGNVGATVAYALLLDGIITDLAIIDMNKEKAEGSFSTSSTPSRLPHTLSFPGVTTTRFAWSRIS